MEEFVGVRVETRKTLRDDLQRIIIGNFASVGLIVLILVSISREEGIIFKHKLSKPQINTIIEDGIAERKQQLNGKLIANY